MQQANAGQCRQATTETRFKHNAFDYFTHCFVSFVGSSGKFRAAYNLTGYIRIPISVTRFPAM
jgi:hypothetical protein